MFEVNPSHPVLNLMPSFYPFYKYKILHLCRRFFINFLVSFFASADWIELLEFPSGFKQAVSLCLCFDDQ